MPSPIASHAAANGASVRWVTDQASIFGELGVQPDKCTLILKESRHRCREQVSQAGSITTASGQFSK